MVWKSGDCEGYLRTKYAGNTDMLNALSVSDYVSKIKNKDGSYSLYDYEGNFLGYKNKRIYTIEEASIVSGTKNSVIIRYK